ncbi:MAG: chemotaxis-specific protein-glutamate methyltransferase CheB [Planctomycetota bacterium]|jgi:two-component system response regulator WspF
MRVAIVNDLRLATEVLRRVVLSDPAHEIAWTAVDGEEAVRRCGQDPPDVVLMDLVMPVMDGAEATRRIMQRSPCPVLVVTATVAGNYALVCEALGHGAYDAVCTPSLGDASPSEAGAELLRKLTSVDRIRRHLGSRGQSAVAPTSGPRESTPPGRPAKIPLVAVGASTGGPQALERVLSKWPREFPAGVVVAQHIGADFVGSLVQWLSERCPLGVRLASPGDSPQPGTVLVAGTNDHLVMTANRTLAYTPDPVDSPYRPSVDVLFASLAEHWPWPSVAVVLTGIGRDGADGLLRLRGAGWHTVAQDEATSVVYGMPQAAREIGAAARVFPIDEMAAHIADRVSRSG